MTTWIMLLWVRFPYAASIESWPGLKEYTTQEECLKADPTIGLDKDDKILVVLCVQGRVHSYTMDKGLKTPPVRSK